MFDLNRRPILLTIGRRFRSNMYIPVYHTNRRPIKNTIGLVKNRLVGMALYSVSIVCLLFIIKINDDILIVAHYNYGSKLEQNADKYKASTQGQKRGAISAICYTQGGATCKRSPCHVIVIRLYYNLIIMIIQYCVKEL